MVRYLNNAGSYYVLIEIRIRGRSNRYYKSDKRMHTYTNLRAGLTVRKILIKPIMFVISTLLIVLMIDIDIISSRRVETSFSLNFNSLDETGPFTSLVSTRQDQPLVLSKPQILVTLQQARAKYM